MDALVLEYLDSCGYQFSTSVFQAECGAAESCCFSRDDLMQLLQLHRLPSLQQSVQQSVSKTGQSGMNMRNSWYTPAMLF